jgi:competence protein ComEC
VSMLAILSFSFAGAVFCANYLPLESLLLPLGCGFALAFGFTFLPQVRKRPRGRTARYAAFGLALGCLWTAGYSWVFWRPAELLNEKTVRLTATVSQWPQETDYGGFSVLARADTEG